MGTRNRFNPCHPCCTIATPPCSDCAGTPPDPLPIAIANAANHYCSDCGDLNGAYLLPRIKPCTWAFVTTLNCGYLYGMATPVTVSIRASVQYYIFPGNVRKASWSGYVSLGRGGVTCTYTFWDFALAVSPIDCSAQKVLPRSGVHPSDGFTYFCDLLSATFTINP